MEKAPLIYGTENSEYLSRSIAEHLQIEHGTLYRTTFQDGEVELSLVHPDDPDPRQSEIPRNRQLFIVGSTDSQEAQAELEDLIAGFTQRFQASSVHAVVPFLGYSTAERSEPGSGVFARGVYRSQSLLTGEQDGTTFYELHAPGLKDVGGRETRADMVSAIPFFERVIDDVRQRYEDLILISPDAGRAKLIERLARLVDLPYEVLKKNRTQPDLVQVGDASEALKGMTAIMADDLLRTGGTAREASDSCYSAGAENVIFMAPHVELPGDSEQKMQGSSITEFHVSNSHPRSQELSESKFIVHDIAADIAERLQQYM